MEYIKVFWIHESPEDPVILYSELDGERYETRKVEVFKNGFMEYASADIRTANTDLGTIPIPSFDEIRDEEENFDPYIISKEEFESVWIKATVRN